MAVVGATGFVGSAVVSAAEAAGHEVVRISGFRLDPAGLHQRPGDACHDAAINWLCQRVEHADAVINCAGEPDSLSEDVALLHLANGLLPLAVGIAAKRADVSRFVHVSSAVVQGRLTLDETPRYDAPSPYAASKMTGEVALLETDGVDSVIFRPPSVHDADRRITRILAKWSARGLLPVEAPGDLPTPQALLPNVADAVVTIACTPTTPPAIVAYPWEGTTVAGLLQSLGGQETPHDPPGCQRSPPQAG